MQINTKFPVPFIFLILFLSQQEKAWSTCPLSPPVISTASASACKVVINWVGDVNTDHYVVKYKKKGDASWIAIYDAGLSNTYSFTGLLANTIYTFAVTSYCSNGQAGTASKINIKTKSCSLPENISVYNIDNTSATISWITCGLNTNAYVRIRPKGVMSWTILPAGAQSTLTVSNLIPETKYQYQVNSCDTSTKSLWTPMGLFTTLSKPAWQPNILLIYLDDCRYDVFTPNGGPSFFQTPAISSIAEEGANFRWCFPALSLCSPSRASIVSGLYPHHHGVYSNALVDTFAHITLAQIMHENNYYTGFVGKYSFEKFPIPGYDYYCQSSTDEYWDTKYQYNSPNFTTIPGHKTDVLTWKALEFLNQVPDGKRFMLFLAHKAPHVPYDSRPQDEGLFDDDIMPFPLNYDKYKKNIPSHYYDCDEQYPTSGPISGNFKKYLELINGAEWSVDTILHYLDSKNLLDSTLIIFTSDNGLLIGEHKLGGKEIALEPSLQLPMFIRYPKWFAPGTLINDEMAMNIDIAPTVLDAAGIPDTFHLDGISMRSLANGSAHRKELFYEFFYRSNCNPTFQAVRDFQYKYVKNQCSGTSEEFYDLVNDPLETKNLINAPNYATLIALYQDKLDSLEDQYGFVNISDTTLPCSLWSADSSVIQFKANSANVLSDELQLFPNPVHDQITLQYAGGAAGDLHLSVTNLFSQTVFEKKLHTAGGFFSYSLDVSDFVPGIYIVNIISRETHESLLFEKQ